MKKILGLPSVFGACGITALLALYFLEVITVTLWVKYLFLISCLAVVLSLYFRYGKRTLFEDCMFCLRKARRKLKTLNFDKKDRLIGLNLLTIKNYLSFAAKYTEDIYYNNDLHQLKQPIVRLNLLIENLTRTHQAEIRQEREQIVLFLKDLQNTLTEEQQRILTEQKALKEAKKQKSK